jgi:type III restriction enzyme
MITLKPFQEAAINELKKEFLHKWLKNKGSQEIVFKSPTGSGKTVMMAQFLRDITSDPRIGETKRAYIWFAPKGLEAQSKEKLFKYYDGASELNLVDKFHIQNGTMSNNDVLFINWEILRAKNADTRRLRGVSGETGYTFDEYMANTHEKGIQMIVIIDEDHIGGASILSGDIIDVIHPRVIMRVSATPKQNVDVDVPHEAVIEAGLIKEKIIFQTSDDLEKIIKKETDRDHALIDLAYNKRLELKNYYEELGIDINPLVLIQLPNDDKKSKEVDSHTKEEIVLEYLKEKGIMPEHIAIWRDKIKTNLIGIESSNNPVQFLLFKQVVATGWDCPRAGVLVMFRETDGGSFGIQTVGRILRMPEAKYYPVTALNRGYLYTNFEKNKILAEIKNSKDPSLNLSNISSPRKDSVPVYELPTVLMSRSDYNDLGDSFQKTFFKVAEDKFGITNPLKASKTLSEQGFNSESAYVESSWITGIELDNYDDFRSEALDEGIAHAMHMSEHDIERLYNLLCFDFIAKQSDEVKKFAPERSWGKVKTALNVFFGTYTQLSRKEIYALIVRDMVSTDGVLRGILEESLKQYRPLRDKEVGEREARKKRTENLLVPAPVIYFPGNCIENTKYKKCATEICYLSENMPKNEQDFIEFLESHTSIKYWLKNGDSGSDSFAIDYHSVINNKESLFYPDWFIWTDKGLWIVDTKSGITASDPDTAQKANALQNWLLGKDKIFGGIVVPDGPNGWKINTESSYKYDTSLKDFKNFGELL